MIAVPGQVEWILSKLNQRGYEAYLVGGCVRDILLGKLPQDWDVATGARPEQVKACFEGYPVLETGIRHGTVTLLLDHVPYEITTFRKEGAYADHRRPKEVAFIGELEEDLKRRDFTVNAMAYHPKTGLRDCFGGEKDLKDRLIRAVGNPETRFSEDALRILRALRFASTLGFSIEPRTKGALLSMRGQLSFVSPERKREELTKLLTGPCAGRVLQEAPEVFRELFPALGEESVRLAGAALEQLPPRLELRLAALCYGGCLTGERESPAFWEAWLKEQKWSNEVIRRVVGLLSCAGEPLPSDWIGAKGLAARYGIAPLEDSLRLKAAFGFPQGEAGAWVRRLKGERPCLSFKELEVTGRDLLHAGALPGKELGQSLEWLLQEVLEERLPNRKEALLQAFRRRMGRKD